MHIVFSNQELPSYISKSIFLAGPSIRDYTQKDWRHDALAILEQMNYTGTVFVPIPDVVFYGQSPLKTGDYNTQISWEQSARSMADIIVFWIPRNIKNGMYGLTTNFELGEDLKTGKVVYGRPDHADKTRYLDMVVGGPVFNDLSLLLNHAVSFLKDYERTGVEATIPSNVWSSKHFQTWYRLLKDAGNTLESFNVVSVYPESPGPLFFFMAKVSVYVASEDRHKSNEVILGRPDISSVIPYYVDEYGEKHILLVKEFRSPAVNNKGYVYEFPGGSAGSHECISAKKNACKELEEEAGLCISEERIEYVGVRQLASTFSIHQSHLYKVRMTSEEYLLMKEYSESQKVFEDDWGCERTFCVLINQKDIMSLPVDYTTLGMLMEANL